jgi:muramidase (phage lysozyme)
MAENNFDPVTIEELKSFSTILRSVSNSESLWLKAETDLEIAARKHAAAQEQLAQSTENLVLKFTDFGRGLVNDAPSSFSSVSKLIDISVKAMGSLASMAPVVGGALNGLFSAVGEIVNFSVSTFAKAYASFEKLSDSGVITTFEDFKRASDSTALTFADTTNILGKYSKTFALYGKNTADGRKRFESIAYASTEISRNFQLLGIGIADFADYQMNYIQQQTIIARGKQLNDEQLQKDSILYIERLDTLSKLTGISKKDLQDQINDRMKDARYLAAIATLPQKVRETIDGVISNTQQLSAEAAKSIQELIATGGIYRSEDSKAMLLQLGMGGLKQDFFNRLKKGEYTKDEATKMIMTALGNTADSQEYMATQMGKETLQTRFYVEATMAKVLAQRQTIDSVNEINNARNNQLTNAKPQDAALASGRRSMYGTTKNIEGLATSSTTIVKAMDLLASGVSNVTDKLYDYLGDELPEALKLRREENKKTTELNNMRHDLNKQLSLEAKLKTLDPKSKEADDIKTQLLKISYDNFSWGKLLKDQIKTAELDLKDITSRRVQEEKLLNATNDGGTVTVDKDKPKDVGAATVAKPAASTTTKPATATTAKPAQASSASTSNAAAPSAAPSRASAPTRSTSSGSTSASASDITSTPQPTRSTNMPVADSVTSTSTSGTPSGQSTPSSSTATSTSNNASTSTATSQAPTSSSIDGSLMPQTDTGQPPSADQASGAGRSSGAGPSSGDPSLTIIRDLISSVESIGGSYDSLFGNGTKVPLTKMTIADVLQYQQQMIRRGARSTAAGRYQFMSYTLPEYAKKAGLDFNTTLFDAAAQDKLADVLIREKGYEAFKSGRMSKEQFLARLSQAWAGLPNPLKGGASNYAGDGLNRSNTSVQNALAKLQQAQTADGTSTQTAAAPIVPQASGIYRGPSTGHTALLSGEQVVVPVNSGSNQAQAVQDGIISNGSNTRRTGAGEVARMMNDKIERMIDVTNDGLRNQNRALALN